MKQSVLILLTGAAIAAAQSTSPKSAGIHGSEGRPKISGRDSTGAGSNTCRPSASKARCGSRKNNKAPMKGTSGTAERSTTPATTIPPSMKPFDPAYPDPVRPRTPPILPTDPEKSDVPVKNADPAKPTVKSPR